MNFLVNAWYRKSPWLYTLTPLSFLFGKLAARRRRQYHSGKKQCYQCSLPVIIVGNITVGGTGKTPLVIYLASQLKNAGYKPGIISRGYASNANSYPFRVSTNSAVREAGDEALLIAQNTQCPVVIDADRVAALKKLQTEFDCDVVISDDGLQHYALARDIEIVVVDGSRGLGNALLLPAGPLREPVARLHEVDYVICNGRLTAEFSVASSGIKPVPMDLKVRYLCNLKTEEKIEPSPSDKHKKIHAVTGIGNPERFFNSLKSCGFDIIRHIFKDHHAFNKADLIFNDGLGIVMTEKDAVKCREFASSDCWYLKVEASLDRNFMDELINKIISSHRS